MTLENSRAVFEAVMAGASAETVRSQIDDLPCEERELLFSALYGVRDDVAVECRARATEIDRLLRYAASN